MGSTRKIVGRDETAWVLYRVRRDIVHDVYVVYLSDEELVLARIQGHLDELLDYVLYEIEEGGIAYFNFDVDLFD